MSGIQFLVFSAGVIAGLVFLLTVVMRRRRPDHSRPLYEDESKLPKMRDRFAQRPQIIILTPRQLERVNVQRKLRNTPPLNTAGFSNAIARAWDQPRPQPDTPSGWLDYLISYEVLLADHQSHRCAAYHTIVIDPEKPYNGHVWRRD